MALHFQKALTVFEHRKLAGKSMAITSIASNLNEIKLSFERDVNRMEKQA